MSCSSSVFDSAGQWMPSSQADHFAGWTCPLWASSKHGCASELNRTLARRWKVAGCPERSAIDVLTQIGARRRAIFFVGDSQMPDLQEAFVCRALAEAGRQGTPARLVNLRLQPPWHTEICTYRRNNVTGNVTVTIRAEPSECWCDEIFVNGLSLVSCYIRANTHVADVATDLVSSGIARAGTDAIVMNEGLWHANTAGNVGYLSELLASMQAPGPLRDGGVQLVWRELSPQHFDMAGGWFKPWKSMSWSRRCVPNREKRHVVRESLLHQLDKLMPVVFIWNMTVSRWDNHLDHVRQTYQTVAQLAKNAATGVLAGSSKSGPAADCSHYCQPSGVLEAWVDALLIALWGHSVGARRGGRIGARYGLGASPGPSTHWQLAGDLHGNHSSQLGSCALLEPVRSCTEFSTSPRACVSKRIDGTLVPCEYEPSRRVDSNGGATIAACRKARQASDLCPALQGIHLLVNRTA